MSQAKTEHGHHKLIMLDELIQAIAEAPDSESHLLNIVEFIQGVLGASGLVCIIFDEPEMGIAIGDYEDWQGNEALLKMVAVSLPFGLHSARALPGDFQPSHPDWAVSPLRTSETIGAVWLSFETARKITHDEQLQLQPFISALSVVVGNLLAKKVYERSHQLTLSLLNSIVDPLIVLDDERRLLLMNPAAEALFRTTVDLSSGKSFREVFQAEELANFIEYGGELQEWITTDDKTFMPRVEMVHDIDGDPTGWVVALRDVTRFKKLNRNQSEFMRIVSHDLRSPLTSMQGFASMLELGLVGELNEKQKHFVGKILAGITQMTALVDNIQDAGRYDPETGFYDLSRSQVDLGDMVNRIVENHLVPAEKALNITVQIAPDVPIINADANMLERAIINLFDNAIKYTPDGGAIEVGVKRSSDEVIVLVRDTGLGISKDAQQHLFERHVRIAREEHKRIKGSGLGLFIVRSVAQRHGGHAWVESVEGQGSTFFLNIPLDGPNRVVTASV